MDSGTSLFEKTPVHGTKHVDVSSSSNLYMEEIFNSPNGELLSGSPAEQNTQSPLMMFLDAQMTHEGSFNDALDYLESNVQVEAYEEIETVTEEESKSTLVTTSYKPTTSTSQATSGQSSCNQLSNEHVSDTYQTAPLLLKRRQSKDPGSTLYCSPRNAKLRPREAALLMAFRTGGDNVSSLPLHRCNTELQNDVVRSDSGTGLGVSELLSAESHQNPHHMNAKNNRAFQNKAPRRQMYPPPNVPLSPHAGPSPSFVEFSGTPKERSNMTDGTWCQSDQELFRRRHSRAYPTRQLDSFLAHVGDHSVDTLPHSTANSERANLDLQQNEASNIKSNFSRSPTQLYRPSRIATNPNLVDATPEARSSARFDDLSDEFNTPEAAADSEQFELLAIACKILGRVQYGLETVLFGCVRFPLIRLFLFCVQIFRTFSFASVNLLRFVLLWFLPAVTIYTFSVIVCCFSFFCLYGIVYYLMIPDRVRVFPIFFNYYPHPEALVDSFGSVWQEYQNPSVFQTNPSTSISTHSFATGWQFNNQQTSLNEPADASDENAFRKSELQHSEGPSDSTLPKHEEFSSKNSRSENLPKCSHSNTLEFQRTCERQNARASTKGSLFASATNDPDMMRTESPKQQRTERSQRRQQEQQQKDREWKRRLGDSWRSPPYDHQGHCVHDPEHSNTIDEEEDYSRHKNNRQSRRKKSNGYTPPPNVAVAFVTFDNRSWQISPDGISFEERCMQIHYLKRQNTKNRSINEIETASNSLVVGFDLDISLIFYHAPFVTTKNQHSQKSFNRFGTGNAIIITNGDSPYQNDAEDYESLYENILPYHSNQHPKGSENFIRSYYGSTPAAASSSFILMFTLELFDRHCTRIAKSSRPHVIFPRGQFRDKIQSIVNYLPSLFHLYQSTIHARINLIEGLSYKEDSELKLARILMTPSIPIETAHLIFETRLAGIRQFMRSHPMLSLILFVGSATFFSSCLLSCCCFAAYARAVRGLDRSHAGDRGRRRLRRDYLHSTDYHSVDGSCFSNAMRSTQKRSNRSTHYDRSAHNNQRDIMRQQREALERSKNETTMMSQEQAMWDDTPFLNDDDSRLTRRRQKTRDSTASRKKKSERDD